MQLPPSPDVPVEAAGVLVMTRTAPRQFLLMRHPNRWDLPKGHAERGESPRQTALRELAEETGLTPSRLELDEGFEFVIEYPVRYRGDATPRQKRVHYFLGWIDRPAPIECTEHDGGEWFSWNPPHAIQKKTIDPLLAAIDRYLRQQDSFGHAPVPVA